MCCYDITTNKNLYLKKHFDEESINLFKYMIMIIVK